jgi:hypothetical protein
MGNSLLAISYVPSFALKSLFLAQLVTSTQT